MKFLASHRRWSFVKPLWHFSPERGSARQPYGFEASVTFDYPIVIGTGAIRIWDSDFATQLDVISISDPRVTVSANAITFEWTDTEAGEQKWVIYNTYGITIDSGSVRFLGLPWGLTSDARWIFSIAQPFGVKLISTWPDYSDPNTDGIELMPALTVVMGSAADDDSLSEGIEAGTGYFALWRCEAGFPVQEVRHYLASNASYITFSVDGWVGINWGPALLYDTKYSVEISPDAIRDSRYPDWSTYSGLGAGTWFFRTIPEPGPLTVVSLSPPNGATVPVDYLESGLFEIVLSEPADGGAELLVDGVGDGRGFMFSLGETTVTFELRFYASPGRSYSISMSGMIRSVATGAALEGLGPWIITTSL